MTRDIENGKEGYFQPLPEIKAMLAKGLMHREARVRLREYRSSSHGVSRFRLDFGFADTTRSKQISGLVKSRT